MNIKYLIILLPLLALVDLYLWTKATTLLSAADDTAVFLGVLLICIALFGHYILFKLIKSKLNNEN